MRPVRLEVQGFGAFRDTTVIDFEGVEFFALVGPTGSGKSTVIDGICFALYGSVPRYEDERLVEPIITTATVEARVSLRFISGGVLYVATRIARRTAKGATTKEARLEAHHHDGTITVLAGSATEMNATVVDLLGLTFQHFTRCVVLPQGEFAKFLHDKASDRQQVLVKLLQFDVYRTMMQAANARATKADTEAAVIAARIEELGNLGDDALETATSRRATATAVQTWLEHSGEQLRQMEAQRTEASAASVTASKELSALSALQLPNGVPTLAARLSLAIAAHGEATQVVMAAQELLDSARVTLAALAKRAVLESARQDWADLAQTVTLVAALEGELRTATDAATQSSTALEQITTAMAALAAQLEPVHELHAIRDAHHELAGIATQLDANHTACITTGALLSDPVGQRADVSTRVDSLTAVAAQLPGWQALATLQARVARGRGVVATAQQECSRMANVVEAAREALEGATATRAHAHQDADQLARAHQGAAIAAALALGDDCPVCHRPITEVGHHQALPQLQSAESTVRAAVAAEALCSTALSTQQAAFSAAEATVAGHHQHMAELQANIDEQASLLGHSALAGDADEVSRRLDAAVAAEADRVVAATELAKVSAEVQVHQVTVAALQATRHALQQRVPVLEAVVAGEPDRQRLDQRIAIAVERGAQVDGLKLAMVGAQREVAVHREAMAATTASMQAAVERRVQLERRCAGHQPAGDVDVVLVNVDQAERSEAQCIAAHAAAATRMRAVDTDLAACRGQEEAAWKELRAARDTVAAVASQAPPAADGGVLSDAWTALIGWAGMEADVRQQTVTQWQASLVELGLAVEELRSQRHTRVTGELGVDVDQGAPDGELVRITAGAVAAADHELQRITDGRARTASLRSDRQRCQDDAVVARKLGQLLSAKQFEQWLVATALRSLTATASVILERLSGGEYGLESTDANEFMVIDHRNADERRPVRSLSGGETFQASLALALALSQEISGLSARPGRTLDSIFLDEGFGTLDPETLDMVADTIETLGQDGRMVGIITHVRELAERVPVRFRVTKGERTSTVNVETG